MTDKLQQEKVTRWMPLEGSCLEVSGIGWFVRYDDHLAAATAREKENKALLDSISVREAMMCELEAEIASLRAKLAEVPVEEIRHGAALLKGSGWTDHSSTIDRWLAGLGNNNNKGDL